MILATILILVWLALGFLGWILAVKQWYDTTGISLQDILMLPLCLIGGPVMLFVILFFISGTSYH